MRPQTFVELPAATTASASAPSRQQALQNPGDCLCYAVDTWKGDEQAGFYGEEVFNDIATYMHKTTPAAPTWCEQPLTRPRGFLMTAA